MWKTLMRNVGLEEPTSFLNLYIRDVLNVNANLMKQLLKDKQRCLSHVFLQDQLKNYRGGTSLTQKQ